MDEELKALFEADGLSFRDRNEVFTMKQSTTEELQDLDLQIAQLKKQRALAAQKLLYCTATLAPIRTLPADILREIFQRCLPTKHLPLMSSSDAPLLLRRVCKYWKETVDETPSLWNKLHIAIPSRRGPELATFQKAITAWFSKSGSLPISFSFGQSAPFHGVHSAQFELDHTWMNAFDDHAAQQPAPSQAKPTPFRAILASLLPLADRWEGIRMARGAMHEAFATLTPEQIPCLKEVAISVASRASLDSMKNLICAPSIRQLRLPYRQGLHWSEINWANLTTLDIACSSSEGLQYLRRCPNLEVFIMSFEGTELGAMGGVVNLPQGQVHLNIQAGLPGMNPAFPQAPAQGPLPAQAPGQPPAPAPMLFGAPAPGQAQPPPPAGGAQAAPNLPGAPFPAGMPGMGPGMWLQQLQPLFGGGTPEESEEEAVEPIRLEKLHTLRLNGNPKKNFIPSLDVPALNRLSHFTHMDVYGPIGGDEQTPIAFDLTDLMPLQPLSDLEVVDFTMEKSIQQPVLNWLRDHPSLHTLGLHDFFSPSPDLIRENIPAELQNMQMHIPTIRVKAGVDLDFLKSLSGDATDAEGKPAVILPQLKEIKIWHCGRIPAASMIAALKSRFNPPAGSDIVPLERCLVQFACKLSKDERALLKAFSDEIGAEGITPKPVRFQFPEEKRRGYGYTPLAGLLKDPYGLEGYQYAD